MVTTTAPAAPESHLGAEEERVSPLELFFDLVFVFALTQVTAMMAADPTAGGVARGLLVLAAVWWAWAAYAWLTNEADTDRDDVRLPLFASMIAMLVTSLAVPGAFSDDALLFAVAFLIVRSLHILVFAQATDDVEVAAAVRAIAPSVLLSPGVIVLATLLDSPAQELVWLAVLACDYTLAGVRGIGGWKLSPAYFAERHGLIIIIALGESIVAVGAGLAAVDLGADEIVGASAGVVIAAALWWAYFDVVAPVAERTLRAATPGREQNTLARDSYSYLHMPMVAGIVLFALGIKKSLEHIDESLALVPAIALCGGVALYLLAHIAFRLRNVHSLNRQRLATAAILLGLIPLAANVPAVWALLAVATVCASLIAYEAIRHREARARVRVAT